MALEYRYTLLHVHISDQLDILKNGNQLKCIKRFKKKIKKK